MVVFGGPVHFCLLLFPLFDDGVLVLNAWI